MDREPGENRDRTAGSGEVDSQWRRSRADSSGSPGAALYPLGPALIRMCISFMEAMILAGRGLFMTNIELEA